METAIEKSERIKFERDIKYIQEDLIAPLNNGNYCKFSRALLQIAILNKPKEEFYKYWENAYKNNKRLPLIIQALDKKFAEGLVSADDMVKLVEGSIDRDSEKSTVLKLLRPKKVKIKNDLEFCWKGEN